MNKKIKLNEQQFENLLLFEKLSVSDEVVFVANSLIRKLKEDIDEVQIDKTKDHFYSSRFLFRAFGMTFNVEYTVYFEEIPPSKQIQSIDLDNRFIKLSFVYQNELFDNEMFYDGIAHELTHAYQRVMRAREVSDEFYQRVNNVALNKDNEFSVNVSMLAKGLYFSKQVEQDAYIHGMYNQVKEKIEQFDSVTTNDIRRLVLNTRFARLPYILRSIKEIANTDDASFNEMIKLGIFKKSMRKNSNEYLKKLYIQTINNTIKRIQKKIRNVIKRLEYDFFGEE